MMIGSKADQSGPADELKGGEVGIDLEGAIWEGTQNWKKQQPVLKQFYAWY